MVKKKTRSSKKARTNDLLSILGGFEREWTVKGYKCRVFRGEDGTYRGSVTFPSTHPIASLTQSSVRARLSDNGKLRPVHGEVSKIYFRPDGVSSTIWATLMFHCNHWKDLVPVRDFSWKDLSYSEFTDKQMKVLERNYNQTISNPSKHRKYWTMREAITECNYLVRCLKYYEEREWLNSG